MIPSFIPRPCSSPLFGLGIMYPHPGTVERLGANWDWIWIDAQHGDLDFREVVDLIRAANLVGKPVLVRPPGQDAGWISRVLDAGASGVIVPMLESVEEASAMVRAAKFPPLGNRSYGGRRIIDLQGRGYYRTANRDTLLILQIESNEAVTLADQFASMDGVDGLFLGPDDLLIRSKLDVDTPKDNGTIGQQTRAVAQACRKHGKCMAGIGANPAMMEMAKENQFDLIVGGADVSFLASGSKTASDSIRAFFAQTKSSGQTKSDSSSLY